MNGILAVLKPPGMTSHDVVARVRRLSGQKRIGHAGTLDPGACGVLVLCLGKGTKVVSYISDAAKSYRGEATFGRTTSTQDAFGDTLESKDASYLNIETVENIINNKLSGPIMQVPPMVSAVKVGGQRLYRLAREGREVEREPRAVQIFRWNIISAHGFGTPNPVIMFDVSCSKGTYVRTLCHDLGVYAGCGAFMSFLVRTETANFDLAGARTLEEITAAADAGRFEELLTPLDTALGHLARVIVHGDRAGEVLCGRMMGGDAFAVPVEGLRIGQEVLIKSSEGKSLALGKLAGYDLKSSPLVHPFKILV